MLQTVAQDPLNDQMVFDKGAFRSVSNTMRAIKSMQDVFTPPPSKIEQAVQNVVENVSTDIASKMLGSGLGGSGYTSKGIVSDILHEFLPAFGHGLGESLGTNGPETVKTLIASLTGQGNKQSPDNTNEKSKQPENPELSNVEKQKDQVLSLDVNNPEHVKQYATAMGLSEEAAKEMLVYHQSDIINKRKVYSASNASNASNASSSDNNEITEALKILINEISGMKNVISNLNNEMIQLKSERITKPEDLEKDNKDISTKPTKTVNIFQEPIKVDVNNIEDSNLKETFFDDKQSIKEAEFAEEKDKPLEQAEQVIKKDSDSCLKTLGSKDDKKKENEVIKTTKLDIPKAETPKVKILHKRTIHKPIGKEDVVIKEIIKEGSVKEENENNKIINNATLERYDIENKLIKEN